MNKRSARRIAEKLRADLDAAGRFLDDVDRQDLGKASVTVCYEAAILKVTIAFEHAVLGCLVVAINRDTGALKDRTGIPFPRHLNWAVSEYLVVGDGYFDFRGRDGMLREVKRYLNDDHWVVAALKSIDRATLEKLLALRNWAAHDSTKGRKVAVAAIGTRAASAGSWLKANNRMRGFIRELHALADEIERLSGEAEQPRASGRSRT